MNRLLGQLTGRDLMQDPGRKYDKRVMRRFNVDKFRMCGEWAKRIEAERAAGKSFGLVVEVVDPAHNSMHVRSAAAFRVCIDMLRVKCSITMGNQFNFAPGRTE
jgi:hypothetical protein